MLYNSWIIFSKSLLHNWFLWYILKDLIDVDVRVAAVQYLSKFNAFFHDFLYFLLEFLVNKSVMTFACFDYEGNRRINDFS